MASKFRGIGSCMHSSHPEDVLRGVKRKVISITKFLVGFLLIFVTVYYTPMLFMLLVIFFTLLVTTAKLVTTLPTILCRILPTIG